MESAVIVAIVVLGGMGSQIGVAIAAVIMIGGTELMRELDVLKVIFGKDFDPTQYRMLLFGCHGADHDLEAARPDCEPAAFRRSQGPQAGLRRACAGGPWMSAPLLRVEHLTMRFGGLVAINDLSFTAEHGRITALIGPNGAGKTTVFNCITGFYKPTEGRIALQSGDPASGTSSTADRARRARPRAPGRLAVPARAHARLPGGAESPRRAHVPEHPPVPRHDRAGEPAGRAAQRADARFRLDRARRARPAVLRAGRARRDREGARSGSSASGSPTAPTIRPAPCPMARSAGSRSRARCAPTRCCCASTSRRPASTRSESAELARFLLTHPRRARHLDPADRARHVGGDGDLRPRRRARPRRQDRRRHAGRGAQRPEGDRRLSRRRGRGSRRRSKRRSGYDLAAPLRPRREDLLRQHRRAQGRRHRRRRGRDRRADRRQRRRQIDPDDDDLRQSARARGRDHLRRPRHHAACRRTRSRGCRSRRRRKAGASSCA